MEQQLITKFRNAFCAKEKLYARGIGIECEIPIVTEQGEAIHLDIVQAMFTHLGETGFELETDEYSGLLMAAKRINVKSAEKFDFSIDTITTDIGYSTIEIVLAPQKKLYTLQSHLLELLFFLMDFFESQNCRMLGYGIQPVSCPSKKILMPKERYSFLEKLSTTRFLPKSEGGDPSFLTITASNQCHIQIGLEDAVLANNVLNALSGLQIALHANSPIWKGKVDTTYKATREILWEFSYPNRLNQIGIPPQFENIESYVDYLCQFEPLLVQRNGTYFQILNKKTFKDFLLNESPTVGRALNGEEIIIEPNAEDIKPLLSFCFFNARLVPKHGTVESRMCCQQPPKKTLTSAALMLGIIENLQAAQKLVEKFPLETWQEIRKEAAKHTFHASVNGVSILPMLQQLLDIAKEGLKNRNLQEEIFLQPL
ncbi:MAG: glutamate--cysteine ligase [Saprospiraceae bacterium]|jgi:glutamate--cysteine ligase